MTNKIKIITNLEELEDYTGNQQIIFKGDLDLEGYTHPLPEVFTHSGGYLDLRNYQHPLPEGFKSLRR